VKITIVRTFHHVVEVSGRIDKDQASDETGDGNEPPLKRVWPYLSKALKAVLHKVDHYSSLPYLTHLVFIGEIFFESTERSPPVSARSLDAIQSLSALQRIHAIRFRVDDHIYSLRINQAFPGNEHNKKQTANVPAIDLGFNPAKLEDLMKVELPPSAKKAPRVSSAPATSIVFNEIAPTSATSPNSASSGTGSNAVSPNLLHTSAIANGGSPMHKNRGRRVSFGAIRAIPTKGMEFSPAAVMIDDVQEDEERRPTRKSSLSPPPRGSSKSETDEEENTHGQKRDSVAEYVDDMLQKTLNELLVANEE
jgi:hypothetical protein